MKYAFMNFSYNKTHHLEDQQSFIKDKKSIPPLPFLHMKILTQRSKKIEQF